MEKVEVTAKVCQSPYDSTSCREIFLIYPKEQAQKFVNSVVQKGGESVSSHGVDYSQYLEFWSFSFFVTISFWLLAKTYGVVLSFLRR